MSATSRLPLYAGVVGLLVLLFVGILMIRTIRQSDMNADPPAENRQNPQSAAPDKVPPLNK